MDFESDVFWIPLDLVDDVITLVNEGCILCGGGVEQCLKEFSILLNVLDIPHSVNIGITY